jgi:hypothetical protein
VSLHASKELLLTSELPVTVSFTIRFNAPDTGLHFPSGRFQITNQRKLNHKRRASAGLGFDLNASAVLLHDDGVHNRQTLPGALAHRLSREKWVEYFARMASGIPPPVSEMRISAFPSFLRC